MKDFIYISTKIFYNTSLRKYFIYTYKIFYDTIIKILYTYKMFYDKIMKDFIFIIIMHIWKYFMIQLWKDFIIHLYENNYDAHMKIVIIHLYENIYTLTKYFTIQSWNIFMIQLWKILCTYKIFYYKIMKRFYYTIMKRFYMHLQNILS